MVIVSLNLFTLLRLFTVQSAAGVCTLQSALCRTSQPCAYNLVISVALCTAVCCTTIACSLLYCSTTVCSLLYCSYCSLQFAVLQSVVAVLQAAVAICTLLYS